MNQYIILEIIPTATYPENGKVVQLSAIKVDNFNILSRFDFRLNPEHVQNQDLVQLCSYDAQDFTYLNSSFEIMQAFQDWAEEYPLLIINNNYTQFYLDHYNIQNKSKPIFDLLQTTYHNNIIDELIATYHLQPSNYIVDLLFECLIAQSNEQII